MPKPLRQTASNTGMLERCSTAYRPHCGARSTRGRGRLSSGACHPRSRPRASNSTRRCVPYPRNTGGPGGRTTSPDAPGSGSRASQAATLQYVLRRRRHPPESGVLIEPPPLRQSRHGRLDGAAAAGLDAQPHGGGPHPANGHERSRSDRLGCRGSPHDRRTTAVDSPAPIGRLFHHCNARRGGAREESERPRAPRRGPALSRR